MRFLVVSFAALAGNLPAQVLNMSHDLVRLNIASQNLPPNDPSLDARPLFQAAINYVQSHPVQTLTLDTGAYYLLSNTQNNATLIFPNLGNMTIDLAGSTIYFNGPLVLGLQLYDCSNVTLTNFQIDYVHPPYTHVQLTSVDTVNRLLKYQTLPNWPDPSSFNGLTDPQTGGPIQGYWAAIFRNGSIVPGTTRTLLQAPFTNNTITIQDGAPWAQAATLSTLRAGDTIVVYARGGANALLDEFGSGITLSNIAIYGSQAILLIQTSNTTVDNMRIEPRPGSGLVGGVGGINFVPVGANNHIRNSYVARTLDDAIGLNSPRAAIVSSQPAPNQLAVTRYGVHFPNGTLMNFVDRATTLESTAGIIVDQNPPDSFQLPSNVTLTFDRNLPALAPGTILTFGSAAMRGQGSTVEDTLIEDTYGGRGVWLSGVEGVTVQRNVVRRTSNAGIVVESSTESVMDPGDAGPPSSGVTITDNSLEGSLGPQAAGNGLEGSLAAIQVVTTSDPFFVFSSTPSNTNVTIANNYIADSNRSGIWVGELNGGTLQNNLVIRYSQDPTLSDSFGIPYQFASQVMQDALVPVVIHYSSAVAEIGDTISATSSITAPVTMTPPSAAWPGPGGAGSFNLQTAVFGFAWNAVSDSSWLTVTSPVPGAGSGAVQYSVSPNATAASRTGNITIAGVAFSILQTTLTTPVLTIAKTHAGAFTRGQSGATYTLTVSNQAGAVSTSGLATVSDTLPSGLTLVSMAGSGWNCSSSTCSRSDSLAGGASYPPITVTVNVAANASSPQVNQASVSGGGSATANASDSTTIVSPAAISLSPSKLQFGYSGQQITGTQIVALNFNPSETISWTASSNQPNITVNPISGSGSAVLQITAAPGPSGIITITAPGATNSPQQVLVNVTNVAPPQPFGSFDTPANNTTGIAGAIPVTGWALDNIAVTNVAIWREPVLGETASTNGLVFIGDAVFIAGARPDVQNTYPNTPFNNRAGWGYLMLTNFLPNASGSGPLGNGTYKLHALVTNQTGQVLDLGTRVITVDNAHASKPFGTIDTPAQGATIPGNAYVNFGWALTQNPFAIPIDGSTIFVYLDGVALGHPVYNLYRSDIATLFPGLANTNGGVGYYYVDTTALANGLHTIAWSVTDNAGRTDGIGSRYFTVTNTGGGNVPAMDEPIEAAQLATDTSGVYSIEELGRIELPVGATNGYLLANNERMPLPIGSTLKGGRFYWQLGPGFLGEYELVFERSGGAAVRVRVVIQPKSYAPARLQ